MPVMMESGKQVNFYRLALQKGKRFRMQDWTTSIVLREPAEVYLPDPGPGL